MLQNRVDPQGNLIRTAARGALMGNRGVIHNKQQQIVRPYRLTAWITCKLSFKKRHRDIMQPNRWTELFFLDEATAFAAGHRPCAECRREDFNRFKSSWIQGNPAHHFTIKTSIREIDAILQQERIDAHQQKIIFTENVQELPDGVFVLFEQAPYLLWEKKLYRWYPSGYQQNIRLPRGILSVLTPASVVNAFRAGYIAQNDISNPRIATITKK